MFYPLTVTRGIHFEKKNEAKLLQIAELVLPVLRVSIVIGVPLYRRMVYDGKSHLEMDDWGYPHFRKPPFIICPPHF